MKKKLAGIRKKYRILAGPNERQQVCNQPNIGKTGRSCEGADFSWLSSKVSRTLFRVLELQTKVPTMQRVVTDCELVGDFKFS
jgi:hypothetical protein